MVEKEGWREGGTLFTLLSDFHYLWVLEKGVLVNNASTSRNARLPLVVMFKEMPAF